MICHNDYCRRPPFPAASFETQASNAPGAETPAPAIACIEDGRARRYDDLRDMRRSTIRGDAMTTPQQQAA
jgi:hypothetical protein